MSLSVGTRIGPYEILGSLGTGGMGEVYKARDLRLDRTVAIKILPDQLAADPQFRERFDREARSISQLSHPNICTLFDVGEARAEQPSTARPQTSSGPIHYLVLEHLEGETLETRMARGRLTLTEAVTFAIDIAAALGAAHRHGIVHRDLKPGNIFLARTAGAPVPTAKLLDFGIAKAGPPGALASSVTASVATMNALTAQGTLLGTVQYMSPEQIEGQEADARTDIFAFGATLYEMLTGRRAFDGKSQASLIGAILKDEPPPVTQLLPMTPPALNYLVRTCLSKDPDGRFQTAHDVWLQLRWIAEGGSAAGVGAPATAKPKLRDWRVLTAVAAATLVAGAAVAWRLKPKATEAHVVVRFRELLPADQNFSGSRHVIAIANDGSRIAYAANRRLYVREMDALEARLLPETDEALEPVFSPDGQSIAYFASATGAPVAAQPYSIRKIALAGGAPVTLASIAGAPYGAVWRQGLIAFGLNAGSQCGIYAIPEAGGAARALVPVDCQTERAVQPDLLSDRQHVIFGVPLPVNTGRETATGEGPIVVDAVGGGQRKVLIQSGTNPRLLPTGQLAYLHDRSIWAVPFDVGRLEASAGAPVLLVENVARTGASSAGQFAFSANGWLAYVAGTYGATLRRLVWVDRKGGEQPLAAPPDTFQQPRLSPDGTRLAVSAGANIWVWLLASETPMRVTEDAALQYNAAWTPDGRSLLFDSNTGGGIEIVRRPADGTGKSEAVVPVPGGYPEIVLPDGKMLVYHTAPRVAMVAPLDRREPPRPLLDIKAQVSDVELSPGGHWLAYESNESGRFEVYVRPWPAIEAGRWPISSNGGQHPLWSRDGRELFFISASGMMMSAAIKPGPSFSYDRPVELFSAAPYYVNVARNYDVSLDGKRFLVVKSADAKVAKPPVVVVANWFDEVQKRMGKQ